MVTENGGMSSEPSSFNRDHAQIFVTLAALAGQDIKAQFFQENLPDQWDLLALVESETSDEQQFAKAQGFYAKGPLATDSTETVAVLALAIPWAELLNNYLLNTYVLGPPPGGVIAKGDSGGRFDHGLAISYQWLRPAIWENVSKIDDRPFYVVGLGVGGAMAQLATLDLRHDNQGPKGEDAPKHAPPCYVFSTPRVADPDFGKYYSAHVSESYRVWAGTSDLPVDFFPIAPKQGLVTALGQAENLDATRPPVDSPWWERSLPFYISVLGGQPDMNVPENGRIPNPPNKFNRSLADTLARLCSVAYQMRQHPNGTTINISPFTIKENIYSDGTVFCSIFASADTLVVAFRGTVTWAEMANLQLNSFMYPADFIEDIDVNVHHGVLTAYTAPVDKTNDKSPQFRVALLKAIHKHLQGDMKLFITGHSFGGGLANLAAMDIATNFSDLNLSQVYVFGSIPTGGYTFATNYQKRLKNQSFQVARPGDFVPKLIMTAGYFQIDPQVVLQGVPKYDDYTQHPISTYIALLDSRS